VDGLLLKDLHEGIEPFLFLNFFQIADHNVGTAEFST
jgi:hypothetical protein